MSLERPVAAPGDFTATAINSSTIRLDYTDLSSNEIRFIIERTSDGVDWDVVGRPAANSHTFTDRSVDPGTTYNYRIRARASNADSDVVPLASPIATPSVGSDNFASIDSTGTLNFYGTIGNDRLIVSQLGTNIIVSSNGTTRTFSQLLPGGVQRIQVYGLDGDDKITIRDNVGPVNISGGNGDDEIFGNSGADRIDGGDGDDYIHGLGGNDTLLGGNGRDRLFGDAGDDSLDGGNGNDVLRGGLGNDRLDGGNGLDRLFGEGGIDTLNGGRSSDILTPD